MLARVLSESSGFLPTPKNVHVRQNGNSKLTVGECENLFVILCSPWPRCTCLCPIHHSWDRFQQTPASLSAGECMDGFTHPVHNWTSHWAEQVVCKTLGIFFPTGATGHTWLLLPTTRMQIHDTRFKTYGTVLKGVGGGRQACRRYRIIECTNRRRVRCCTSDVRGGAQPRFALSSTGRVGCSAGTPLKVASRFRGSADGRGGGTATGKLDSRTATVAPLS